MAMQPHDFQALTASPYGELARWGFEHLGRAYRDLPHRPWWSLNDPTPLYTEAAGHHMGAKAILRYLDAMAQPDHKFWQPSDQAQSLFDALYDQLGPQIERHWLQAMMPHKALLMPLLTQGLKASARAALNLGYPLYCRQLRRHLGIEQPDAPVDWSEVWQMLTPFDELLADGRCFILGDRLSQVDMAGAALLAPLVMPENHPYLYPLVDELPEPLNGQVLAMRERPCGQWVLRLYQHHRPDPHARLTSPAKTKLTSHIKSKLLQPLLAPSTLRVGLALLRRFAPVLNVGGITLVSRAQEVQQVLAEDERYTIKEINAERILRVNGPFILGMDRGEDYERDATLLRKLVYGHDLQRVQQQAKHQSEALIAPFLAKGRLDAAEISRTVAVRLLGSFFGTPGPNEYRMRHWMRQIFWDVFLNLGNDLSVRAQAVDSAQALKHWYLNDIERLQAMEASSRPDTVLARMVTAMETTDTWLTPDDIRRNLNGVVVGAVDTTAGSVVNILRYFLTHPEVLAQAQEAAEQGQMDRLKDLAWEALRFEPFSPLVIRHSVQHQQLGKRRVLRGQRVFVSTQGAMFDPQAIDQPKRFIPGREMNYLHFGDGLHRCFGERINEIQIPEIVAAFLRLPGLRSHLTSSYEGPFVDTFELLFDPRRD